MNSFHPSPVWNMLKLHLDQVVPLNWKFSKLQVSREYHQLAPWVAGIGMSWSDDGFDLDG